MSSIFAKLNLKSETEILVVNAPASFEPEVASLAGVKILRSPAQLKVLRFALAFVTKQTELDTLSALLSAKADGDAIIWFAYPKQSSKRYKCEFHRDSGWNTLGQAGYEKVRMVAIDEDWSALRFRKAEYIKSLTRQPSRASSSAGKKRTSAKSRPTLPSRGRPPAGFACLRPPIMSNVWRPHAPEISMFITGKCHCGNIALELEWEGDPPDIPARTCGCSFCVKHGGVWTSNPKSKLAVAIRDASLVSKYVFGSRTATFYVCSRCGAAPLVTSEIANHLYAVVNVNVLENVDPSWLHRTAANFEGEDVESRLARRKRNWIADVRVAEGGT